MFTVICKVGKDKSRNNLWLCKCDCGNEKVVSSQTLRRSKSCGCLQSYVTRKRNETHAQSGTKLYITWASMKQRCENKHAKRYSDYGGRGICVCPEWERFEPFYEWAVKSGYKEGLQIDRINNDLGYSPDNCRFVTNMENSRNTRRNHYLEFCGTNLTISEWAEILNVSPKAIQHRLERGWSIEDTLLLSYEGKRKNTKSSLTPLELERLKEDWGHAPRN